MLKEGKLELTSEKRNVPFQEFSSIADILEEIKKQPPKLLTEEINQNIQRIVEICNETYSDQRFFGNAGLNRQILLDKEIALLLTPEVIQYLFTQEPTLCEKINRNTGGVINLRDAIYWGFSDGLLIIKLMPNNEKEYNLEKYNDQKGKYQSHTLMIVNSILAAANIDKIKMKAEADEKAIDLSSLRKEFKKIVKVINRIKKSGKSEALIAVSGFTFQHIRSQVVRNGFKALCRAIKVDEKLLKTLTLDEFCERFLKNPDAILDPTVIHEFYDRVHLQAALEHDYKIIIGGKAYLFVDIFKTMIDKLVSAPELYSACAKEQFILRFKLVASDLQKRFAMEYHEVEQSCLDSEWMVVALREKQKVVERGSPLYPQEIKEVTCAQFYVPAMANLYRKYKDSEADKLSPKDLNLLQLLVLIYGPIFLQNDIDLWKTEDSDLFYNYLVEIVGIHPEKAATLAGVIAVQEQKSLGIFYKIVHDAVFLGGIDADKIFDAGQMYFYKEIAHDNPKALNDMAQLCREVKSLAITRRDLNLRKDNVYEQIMLEITGENSSFYRALSKFADFVTSDQLDADFFADIEETAREISLKKTEKEVVLDEKSLAYFMFHGLAFLRGIAEPSCHGQAVNRKKRDSKEDGASLELRKIDRTPDQFTQSGKLGKEGNPCRSMVMAIRGAPAYCKGGIVSIMLKRNLKQMKTISQGDCMSTMGKKTKEQEENKEKPWSNEQKNKAWDNLILKQKLGGSEHQIREYEILGRHNEVICDIVQAHAIYFDREFCFYDLESFRVTPILHRHAAPLQAVFINKAHRDRHGFDLPMFEYSSRYDPKLVTFNEQQILKMWVEMCVDYLQEKVKNQKYFALNLSTENLKIVSMYGEGRLIFQVHKAAADGNYSPEFKSKINAAIDQEVKGIKNSTMTKNLRTIPVLDYSLLNKRFEDEFDIVVAMPQLLENKPVIEKAVADLKNYSWKSIQEQLDSWYQSQEVNDFLIFFAGKDEFLKSFPKHKAPRQVKKFFYLAIMTDSLGNVRELREHIVKNLLIPLCLSSLTEGDLEKIDNIKISLDVGSQSYLNQQLRAAVKEKIPDLIINSEITPLENIVAFMPDILEEKSEKTPLELAVGKGCFKVVKWLYANGKSGAQSEADYQLCLYRCFQFHITNDNYAAMMQIYREYPKIIRDYPDLIQYQDILKNSEKNSSFTSYIARLVFHGQLEELIQIKTFFPEMDLNMQVIGEDYYVSLLWHAIDSAQPHIIQWLLQSQFAVARECDGVSYLQRLGLSCYRLLEAGEEYERFARLFTAFPNIPIWYEYSIGGTILQYALAGDVEKTSRALNIIFSANESLNIEYPKLALIKMVIDYSRFSQQEQINCSHIITCLANIDNLEICRWLAAVTICECVVHSLEREIKSAEYAGTFDRWKNALRDMPKTSEAQTDFVVIDSEIRHWMREHGKDCCTLETRQMILNGLQKIFDWLGDSVILPQPSINPQRLFKKQPLMEFQERQALPNFVL